MVEPRKLKKSESLEIRLPHPTKEAFMARCRSEGRSASEALRAFIDGELATAAPRRRSRKLLVGALIAAALGAVSAPTLAHTSADSEFHRLDANRDGRITLEEFRAGRGGGLLLPR